MGNKSFKTWFAENSIWCFAFGYFAFYVPYSFMVKLLTKGLLPSLEGVRLVSFQVLPLSVMASAVGMVVFLSAMRWWKYASHVEVLGLRIPCPTRWTFLSGVCTGLIIGTTTLAYTFEGVSIVFAMLLMRGGVLILAPVVDLLSHRHVRWFSWMGLVFALGALFVSLADNDSYTIPTICAIDIAIYLASYFVRLRFMSKLAKSAEADANRRYFVEEQMVAAPFLVVLIGIGAIIGEGQVLMDLRTGFTDFWDKPFLFEIILVGLFSQGTGVCGSLIFLDKRENTFCVPVNRSSSILAGVIASSLLLLFPGTFPPATSQLIGASLIIGAILFLTIPPGIAKARAKRKEREDAA